MCEVLCANRKSDSLGSLHSDYLTLIRFLQSATTTPIQNNSLVRSEHITFVTLPSTSRIITMADQPAPATAGAPDGTAPATNLQENSYDVEVQLSDLQKDSEHPLGSAATFQELGLSVPSRYNTRHAFVNVGFIGRTRFLKG